MDYSLVSLRIPLTLAILDGLLVSVGEEVFVLPLTQVMDSLHPERQHVQIVAGEGQVLHIRKVALILDVTAALRLNQKHSQHWRRKRSPDAALRNPGVVAQTQISFHFIGLLV